MSTKNLKRRALAQSKKNVKTAKVETRRDAGSTSRHMDGYTSTIRAQPLPTAQPIAKIPQLAPIPLTAALQTEIETVTEAEPRSEDDAKNTQVCLQLTPQFITYSFMLIGQQTSEILKDFMAIEDELQDWLLQRYGNPHEGQLCSCGNGYRLVRCRWDGCFQYPTSCEDCWLKNHKHNPFHWALVWDSCRKIWKKQDYSQLGKGSFIQLGHDGEESSCSSGREPIDFYITHINGVHSTRIKFCLCHPTADPNDKAKKG